MSLTTSWNLVHLSRPAALTLAALLGAPAGAHAACPNGTDNFTQAFGAVNSTNLCQTAAPVAYGSSKFSFVKNGTTQSVRSNLTFTGYRPETPPGPPVPGSTTPQPVVSPNDGFAGQDRKRPVILWVFGGAFATTSNPAQMEPYARLFASYGFVSLVPKYQLFNLGDLTSASGQTDLSVDSVSQEAQRDLQTNVRYLRARANSLGINKNAIYVAGISAGGIVSLRLANRSEPAEVDASDRDHLVDANGTPLPNTATAGQSGQPSNVNGAVAISGTECFAGHPNQVKLLGGTVVLQWGQCHVDTDPSGDAPFWMISGEHDQSISNGWVTASCNAYANCQGTTFYTRYSPQYFTGPNHSDGSWGTCKLPDYMSQITGGTWWVNGLDSFPGGDHNLSDAWSCESRVGIQPDGNPASGIFNNQTKAPEYRTIALNLYRDLQPLAVAAPLS